LSGEYHYDDRNWSVFEGGELWGAGSVGQLPGSWLSGLFSSVRFDLPERHFDCSVHGLRRGGQSEELQLYDYGE